MRRSVVLGLAAVLGCIAAAFAAGAAERLAADSPRTLANGASFTAPADWGLTATANVTRLDPPEGDSHLALVEVTAPDADAAVAAAWAAYRPAARRPLKITPPPAPWNGWEERRRFFYETSPNEKVVVYALAWRAAGAWTVIIVEASDATFEKRSAAFALAVTSLRPKGYERELFTGKAAHPLTPERLETLRGFIRSVMEGLRIPGAAVGIVQDGRLVLAEGFGVKLLGRPDPVDADTMFLAASNTKAMTTLLLAELVDEKKLDWEQPVTEVYPAFRMGDATVTGQVRVKHLVCACTGLPRQDFEWLFNFAKATPASSLASLAGMQPTSRFGEVFQYSNPMAAAAGFIGGAMVNPGQELGAAYDEAMRQKVFAPLGMQRTTFDFAHALAGNVALPHSEDPDGRTQPSRMDINYSVVAVRPTGGMWTTVPELSRYLQLELAGGLLPDGRRLVSEANLLERRRAQIQTGEDAVYGMGLGVGRRYGIPVVGHGGSMFGYKSSMFFLPEQGVGAVVLTNADTGGYLTGLFQRRLLEVLFDGRPEAEEQAKVAVVQRAAEIAKYRERLQIPPDAAAVAALAPRYVNPGLGRLQVRSENGATVFAFEAWQSAVATRRNDDGSTSLITIDPSVSGFDFVIGEREGKKTLTVRDAQHEYAFVEAAP